AQQSAATRTTDAAKALMAASTSGWGERPRPILIRSSLLLAYQERARARARDVLRIACEVRAEWIRPLLLLEQQIDTRGPAGIGRRSRALRGDQIRDQSPDHGVPVSVGERRRQRDRLARQRLRRSRVDERRGPLADCRREAAGTGAAVLVTHLDAARVRAR